MKFSFLLKTVSIVTFLIFVFFSLITGNDAGTRMGRQFLSFLLEMIEVLPCAFLLIGLFEVWIKPDTVERHLGRRSGMEGYFWAILLAGTTVGGLYLAFPVACSLYSKGAKLSVIFTYLSASAICRIPMTLFEMSFLGVKFTLIRLFVSLPLVIMSSMLLGNYLEKKNYRIQEGQ